MNLYPLSPKIRRVCSLDASSEKDLSRKLQSSYRELFEAISSYSTLKKYVKIPLESERDKLLKLARDLVNHKTPRGVRTSTQVYVHFICRVKKALQETENLRLIFIESNIKLSLMIANRFCRKQNYRHDDISQYAHFGLMKAVDRFDPNRNVRFSTYATYWIQAEILRSIAKYEQTIRLPYGMYGQFRKFKRSCDRLHRKGEPLNEENIAKESGLDADTVQDFLNVPFHSCDIREELYVDESFEEHIMEQELHEAIYDELENLKKMEKEIVIHRFGLNDEEPKYLYEIGRLIHRSREYIRLLQNSSLDKLKNGLSKKDLI